MNGVLLLKRRNRGGLPLGSSSFAGEANSLEMRATVIWVSGIVEWRRAEP